MTATTDGKALFRAFLACLIVASLPIKNSAYVTPALYLLILWLHREYRVVGRVCLLCSAILTLSSIAVLWDHLGGRTVNFPGLWLGLVSYAPLFVVLCETFSRTIDGPTYNRFVRVCAWFILLQSAVGVFQFVATGNPDAVCGTLGLLDGFQQTITIAQVYFTFLIFAMILFLVPVGNQWLPRTAIAVGAITCVLAQSGHQTVFFVGVLAACGLVRVSRLSLLARTVGAAAVITVLVQVVYPDTFWVARQWFDKVTDASNSPKRLVYDGAVSILDEPKNLLIGTGLGQYSSRAALITSNEYLSVELPRFMTGKSEYFDDHIEPSLLLFDDVGEGSAIAKPYMSVISLPVEFGLVLSIVLLAVIGRCVVWCVRVMTANDGEVGWIGFSMMVGMLFFVLCCMIENYAEFSQAVFVPFILFVVAGSRAQTALRAAEKDRFANRAGESKLKRTSYALPARLLPR
jgi:hypothetical protein